MSKISTDLRGRLPNRICSHFDKYCELINPLTFDPVKDLYRPAVPDKEWDALQVLIDSDFKSKFLSLANTFDLYIGDKGQSKYRRTNITFYTNDATSLPDMDIELSELPLATQ